MYHWVLRQSETHNGKRFSILFISQQETSTNFPVATLGTDFGWLVMTGYRIFNIDRTKLRTTVPRSACQGNAAFGHVSAGALFCSRLVVEGVSVACAKYIYLVQTNGSGASCLLRCSRRIRPYFFYKQTFFIIASIFVIDIRHVVLKGFLKALAIFFLRKHFLFETRPALSSFLNVQPNRFKRPV